MESNRRVKVSATCKWCRKMKDNNLVINPDYKKCIKCYKIFLEIQELNHFIDRMNDQHKTDVPKFATI